MTSLSVRFSPSIGGFLNQAQQKRLPAPTAQYPKRFVHRRLNNPSNTCQANRTIKQRLSCPVQLILFPHLPVPSDPTSPDSRPLHRCSLENPSGPSPGANPVRFHRASLSLLS